MEDRDYELISKMADQAYDKAAKAKANAERFQVKAGEYAIANNHAEAEVHRKWSAGYLNDYFYWIGHHNAYKGIAAGLALRDVVKQEMEEEGSCP